MQMPILTILALTMSSGQVSALRFASNPDWDEQPMFYKELNPSDKNESSFDKAFNSFIYQKGKERTTMAFSGKLRQIWDFINLPQVPIEGDIVECGVWKGGASMLMALAELNAKKTAGLVANRSIWLFDTFEGLTQPGEKDDPEAIKRWAHAGQLPVDKSGAKPYLDEHGEVRWNYGPLETVRQNMNKVHYPEEQIRYVKGKVEDTLSKVENLPEKIAVLRLDTDWYASTKVELDVLFPRLVPGGLLQIDDYCRWQGSRTATNEWLKENADKLENFEEAPRTDKEGCFTKLKKRG